MFEIDTEYPTFRSVAPVARSIPTTYQRESVFTAVNLIKVASALAAGWVIGNTHPSLAIGAIAVLGFVLAVRLVFFGSRR